MIEERIKYLLAFFLYVFRRYAQNRCSSIAAELTVTSLLALVPLTAVVFALLAFIPSFQDLGEQIQTLLFQYFVPSTGETVQSYLNEFVGKARGLSGVGTLMLIVTALLLMRTIDSSFNKIWQVQSNQSVVRTFLVYWSVLTLGPILLGSSLLITSYIKSLPMISNVVSDYGQWMTLWLPFLMACLAFSVMYYIIPNRKIPLSHALLSGLVTASLFEVAKWGFGVFVSSFSTYQLIFGALAAVPLFLIWIYLSWGIVLFGAEFCHGLEAFEPSSNVERLHPFIEVVSLIMLLSRFQAEGKTLDENSLNEYSLDGNKSVNFDWLQTLVEKGLVGKLQDQSYCLIKSADSIAYANVFNIAGRMFPSRQQIKDSELPEKTQQSLLSIGEQYTKLFSTNLVI